MSHELTVYISVFDLFLTQWSMAISTKGCKPDNFESHNSLKLTFTSIGGLCSNFVECESSLESRSPNILAQCQTNLDDSTDYGNSSVRSYLPITWKDSVTYMHGLAFYVKEGLPFPWDLSLENSVNSYLCFDWLYFTQYLTSFSYIDHHLHVYPRFMMPFPLTKMRFSL